MVLANIEYEHNAKNRNGQTLTADPNVYNSTEVRLNMNMKLSNVEIFTL